MSYENDPNGVRKPSAEMVALAEPWGMIAALSGGTSAMRKAGKAYLPQWPNEGDEAYRSRLSTAVLFPAFKRTVEVLAGKPFSKSVTATDLPQQIEEYTADVDMTGRNLHAFVAGVFEEALERGLSGILVDFPKAEGVTTKADEKAAGLRPYFVQIHPGNILGWKAARINGEMAFTQLRLLEVVTVKEGRFSEKKVEQVRVLEPGRWEVWRLMPQDGYKEVWSLFEEGSTSITCIPFVPIYGKRIDFMQSEPPLVELAHMNVEHWQSKSDQQTILHVARVPILFGKALGDAPITVGASNAILCDNPDSDLRFVEHTGKAIDAGRLSLLDLEDKMRQVGAELLVIKPGNVTETQTIADNEPGKCTLQRLVQDAENAVDTAFRFMGEWIGLEHKGRVTIFSDFGSATLAEASADLLRAMNIDRTLSNETLFAEMQRRGLISPDLIWEQEKQRIAGDPPKPGQTINQD